MLVNFESLRERINAAKMLETADWFSLLRDVSMYLNTTRGKVNDIRAQELVIRLLDIRHLIAEYENILSAFIREAGLFPYLQEESLCLADSLAYEAHRSTAGAETVFHRVQAQIFELLMSGRSVVLSAPTSFGKSLIVDSVVASNRYKNIVIVVPTLALLDETRRRLTQFSSTYRIITHSSQQPGSHNIFVHTQERVVENPNISKTDFFVIDEFYKLNPGDDAERAETLNVAFHKLAQQAKQFYMLGPNIENIPNSFKERFNCIFVKTDFNTVVSEIHQFDVDDDVEHAIQLCSKLEDATLVYVRSPGRAHEVAIRLAQVVRNAATKSAAAVADWIRQCYHADWSFANALDAGVGVHHGKLPRSLTQLVVRKFNEGALRYLVCTSTLIEGVNTRAKNVVVLDNKVAARKFDYFTYSNIRGRSGRMFKHFIGHVYLYHEPPQPELPLIDIPIVTQSEDASDALLIQLEPHELTTSSRGRVGRYYDDPLLSLEVLRDNAGIDPGAQLALAQFIVNDIATAHAMLGWRGYPTYEEFKWTCELLWEHFTDHRRRSGVSSGKQLAYLLMRVLKAKNFSDAVAVFQKDGRHVDEAIEGLLDFQRQWAEFRAPNLLSALGRIQRYIFERYGYVPGNYDAYVTQLENLGRSPVVNALDEYGLPTQVGQIVWESIGRPESLDDALIKLREANSYYVGLSPFENELVREICVTLPAHVQ